MKHFLVFLSLFFFHPNLLSCTSSSIFIPFPLFGVRLVSLTTSWKRTKLLLRVPVSVSLPVFFISVWAYSDRLCVSLILAFSPLKENKVLLFWEVCYLLSPLQSLSPAPISSLQRALYLLSSFCLSLFGLYEANHLLETLESETELLLITG